jgi:hypothetical protein
MTNIFLKLVYMGFYGVETGSSFLCEGENCQAFFLFKHTVVSKVDLKT